MPAGLAVVAGEHSGELVAAQPRHQIAAAERRQPVRDGLEHPVAGVVSERVVDGLEAVQVQNDDDRRPVGAQQRRRERAEQAPVRKAREFVVAGGPQQDRPLRLQPHDLRPQPRQFGVV